MIQIVPQKDFDFKKHTTFGIGGKAREFIEVTSISQMQAAILYAQDKKIPFFVLGKGSNCLFDERGINALVILNKIHFCKKEKNQYYVGAGYSFSHLGIKTARDGYTGLEFASGIPGSCGGAVFMNAGANGSETANVISEVEYITQDGKHEIYQKDQLHFSYRKSCFHEKKGAIVACCFTLKENKLARERQLEIVAYRKKTQPLSEKSVGCIFRNPDTMSAGALIEKCKLKGLKVGDAKVSDIHANFIINVDRASSKEVLTLMNLIQKTVKEKEGIELELEVRSIPYQV